jgi:serine/threonine-protein kinase
MVEKTIAHYEVLDEIGAGGMGVVYRAWDTRLERKAAIKALPEELAEDPERLARLEREAKLLAGLKSPYIATVYGLEAVEGRRFLAMELVEGEALAESLSKGPLPVRKALELARQIAEALEEAHVADVIHRDIKPGNIMIGEDGNAKVLDFGLAKALKAEIQEVDASLSPTLTQPMTHAGWLLGTPVYMSPEQATGSEAGKQSDIWAFGCVLYEMLTGERPFSVATVGDAEVVPDWKALPGTTPTAVRRLLRRCLAKDPRQRLRDIGDARLELDEAHIRPDVEGPSAPVTPAWRRGLPWVLAAVAVVAAVASWLGPRSEGARPAHVQIGLPPGVVLAVDTEHPVLALSPDGTRLVFGGEEEGVRRLYLRDLAVAETRTMAGTEGAASPFFSPDGRWIGFLAEGSLKKVSVDGGVPVAIHRSPGPVVNSGNTWAEGDIVISSLSANEGLSRASMVGDSMRPIDEWKHITDVGSATAWPHALPDGKYVAYVDTSESPPDEAPVAALDLQRLETKTLFRGGTNPRYSPTGHLLFVRGGSLYSVPFDSGRAEVTGVERELLDGVMTAQNGAAQFAVGGNGTLAYVTGGVGIGDDELVWVDRQGRTETILESSHLSEPRLSPDGTRLLVTSRTGPNIDLWLLDLERSTFTRLTSDPGEDLGGVWSPDGTRLALASEIESKEGGPALAWMPRLNATPEVLVESTASGDWEFVSSWSPDGRWLAYTAVRGASQRGIWLFPIGSEEAAEPIPFLDTPANELDGTFSPDGRWMAYVSDVSGHDEIYVRSFSDPNAAVIPVSTRGGTQPRWSRDGKELFYLEGRRFMAVGTGSGGVMEPATPEVLFEGRHGETFGDAGASYDVSLDGSRFVMARTKDLVMPTVIQVVLNWPAALSADVQTKR